MKIKITVFTIIIVMTCGFVQLAAAYIKKMLLASMEQMPER